MSQKCALKNFKNGKFCYVFFATIKNKTKYYFSYLVLKAVIVN